MTTCYKLTDDDYATKNNTSWGKNITHKLPEKKKYTLCSGDVIHAYPSAELAVLMDVIHGGYLPYGILWECIGEEVVADGTKIGCRVLTTLRQITVPSCTLSQRIAFGILCAQYVYKDPDWNAWAKKWLSGEDRSKKSARAVSYTSFFTPFDACLTYADLAAQAAATAATYTGTHTATASAIRAAEAAAYTAHSPNNKLSFINNAAQAALNKTY